VGEGLKRVKILTHILIAFAAFFLLSSRSAGAPGFLLTSPDHPAIWYNRAGDKVSQQLVWDDSKQELVSYVAYSEVEFLPTRDQTYYDSFCLTFPTARLDASTNQVYFNDKHGRRITIGHLESGIMGNSVVLSKGVQFSEHRNDGVVHAAIASCDSRN